ncbi:hypothetical protein [Gilliamella sp. CG22]|uniref:hypothetical protein n=1 Tax=Gilliamella sp. CG22 TaxID=3351504 RepID=UPI003986E6A8
MFHLDNNSGIDVMPTIKQTSSRMEKWFTEGDAQTPPSYPGADWFNIVQAELLNVLGAAGIQPVKSELGQLSAAVRSLVSAGAFLPAQKSDDVNYQVDRIVNFSRRPMLNGSDVVVKSDFVYEVTPSTTVLRRADGLIIQHFRASYHAGHGEIGTVVSLPVAFPTGFYFVMCGDGYNGCHSVSAVPNSLSSVRIWGKNDGVYTDSSVQMMAIGR